MHHRLCLIVLHLTRILSTTKHHQSTAITLSHGWGPSVCVAKPPWAELDRPAGALGTMVPPRHSTAAVDDHSRWSRALADLPALPSENKKLKDLVLE